MHGYDLQQVKRPIENPDLLSGRILEKCKAPYTVDETNRQLVARKKGQVHLDFNVIETVIEPTRNKKRFGLTTEAGSKYVFEATSKDWADALVTYFKVRIAEKEIAVLEEDIKRAKLANCLRIPPPCPW